MDTLQTITIVNTTNRGGSLRNIVVDGRTEDENENDNIRADLMKL